jgi:hypothetical protein
MAAPAPVVPVGTVAAPAEARPDEQFFTPAVLQPITQLPPAPLPAQSASSGRKATAIVGVIAFVIAAGATAWFSFRPGAGGAAHQTPTALAPRGPTAGLPTSLSVIVRVEAESTRHTALETIEAAGNTSLATLAANQPDYQWIAGDRPSTDPKTVSVGENGSVVTIAVAASNHDVCAFGQWSPNSTPVYVTMEHQQTCAASDAPASGWSTQAGGAASDLPDAANG